MNVVRAEHCGMWHVLLDGNETFRLGEKNMLVISGHAAPNTMCIRFTTEQLNELLDLLQRKDKVKCTS